MIKTDLTQGKDGSHVDGFEVFFDKDRWSNVYFLFKIYFILNKNGFQNGFLVEL